MIKDIRKDILILVALMVVVSFMPACSSIKLQTPQERMTDMITDFKQRNPDYTVEVNQFTKYDLSKNVKIQSCGYITKIKSAKYCQINVAENSTRALQVNLWACENDEFNGNMIKVAC